MTAQIITKKKADVMTKVPRGFNPVNAPKPNSVAVACEMIGTIVLKAPSVEGLTPLGHKAGCKGGIIDITVLSGNVHSLESFIDSLSNSGLGIVEKDRSEYPLDTFRAVLAKRVVDHISWCASTSNNSHGGFASRLEKVGLAAKREELGELLKELSGLLQKQYTVGYAPLYNARNK